MTFEKLVMAANLSGEPPYMWSFGPVNTYKVYPSVHPASVLQAPVTGDTVELERVAIELNDVRLALAVVGIRESIKRPVYALVRR